MQGAGANDCGTFHPVRCCGSRVLSARVAHLLDGYYCSEPNEVPACWDGRLRGGGTFWAAMVPDFCQFTLSEKYTGFWLGQSEAVGFTARFEAEFKERFGPLPLIRLDEFVMGKWEQVGGRDWWWESARPFESLLDWLQTQTDYDDHWDLLATDRKPS
jgi:hypothetical protein